MASVHKLEVRLVAMSGAGTVILRTIHGALPSNRWYRDVCFDTALSLLGVLKDGAQSRGVEPSSGREGYKCNIRILDFCIAREDKSASRRIY